MEPVRLVDEETIALDSVLVGEETAIDPREGVPATSEAVAPIAILDVPEISGAMSHSLADVLDQRPGVSRRSFGSAITRPIVRGFNGARVLILEDGISGLSLASQSGDPPLGPARH